jgi:hypothetical protein
MCVRPIKLTSNTGPRSPLEVRRHEIIVTAGSPATPLANQGRRVEEIRLVRWNDCVAGAGVLRFQTPLAKLLVSSWRQPPISH